MTQEDEDKEVVKGQEVGSASLQQVVIFRYWQLP